MPPPFRVGIIGLGNVAVRHHLPLISQQPRLQITAAGDVDRARGEALARQFSIPFFSTDPAQVIASAQVDLVVILTPPLEHGALAQRALDAGKHVFIEKPMTFDPAEGAALADKAAHAKTHVIVGFNQRHHTQLQRARAMLRAGHIGEVRTASAFLANSYRVTDPAAWQTHLARGGDLLFELGVHHFDALSFLMDAEVTSVHAHEAQTVRGAKTVTTQLQFTNGVPATTTLVEDALELNTLQLTGERGCVMLSLYRSDGLQVLPRGTHDGSPAHRVARAQETFATLPSALIRLRRGGVYEADCHRAEWEHIVAVLEGRVEPLASAREGLQATRVAHAARTAIREGKPIAL